MSRRKLRTACNWVYADGHVTLDIPVSTLDEHSPETRKHTYFLVALPEMDIRESDDDINRLRNTVFAKIRDWLRIDWQPKLLVELSHRRTRLVAKQSRPDTPDTRTEADWQLSCTWSRWQLATHQRKKLSRQFGGYRSLANEPPLSLWFSVVEGWPATGVSQRYGQLGTRQLIDDTPANRLALEALADDLESLRTQLSTLLGRQLKTTLAAVSDGAKLQPLVLRKRRRTQVSR